MGGVAKREKSSKKLELEYSFDRLSAKKIIQIYQLLVPDKIWETSSGKQYLEEKEEDIGHEHRRDIRSSILWSSKRGAHNPSIEIPYFDRNKQKTATKYRNAVKGDDRFRWGEGSKMSLYGLPLVKMHFLEKYSAEWNVMTLPKPAFKVDHLHLHYRRQFFIGPKAFKPILDWQVYSLKEGLILSVHSDLDFAYEQFDNHQIVLLGIILDPLEPEKSSRK